MIQLHRIGHDAVAFHLNPDLILSVESHPDTVVTLTTGDRFLVAESADEVCAIVNRWRSGVMADALGPFGARRSAAPVRAVEPHDHA